MDELSRYGVRRQLQEEIARIEDGVAAKGIPRTVEERSLIARYGKLLLLAQRLLNALPRVESIAGDDHITQMAADGVAGKRARQRIRRIGGRI